MVAAVHLAASVETVPAGENNNKGTQNNRVLEIPRVPPWRGRAVKQTALGNVI
jgi:hypothetical protein